jgi:segregation and condensation protein B
MDPQEQDIAKASAMVSAPTGAAEDSPCADAPNEAPEDEAVSEVDLAAVEAILFASDSTLSPAKIAEVACMDGGRQAARRAVETLNQRYERMGCSFRVESLAGGYQMLTLPEFNDVLARLLKVRTESKLSQAGLETLAIIAYKQPILRADVEAIRGVSSGEMLRGLIEKGLVKIVGRAEEIGRPMLYGTTRRFMEVFGLASLKDLPQVAELAGGALAEKPAASQCGSREEGAGSRQEGAGKEEPGAESQ